MCYTRSSRHEDIRIMFLEYIHLQIILMSVDYFLFIKNISVWCGGSYITVTSYNWNSHNTHIWTSASNIFTVLLKYFRCILFSSLLACLSVSWPDPPSQVITGLHLQHYSEGISGHLISVFTLDLVKSSVGEILCEELLNETDLSEY